MLSMIDLISLKSFPYHVTSNFRKYPEHDYNLNTGYQIHVLITMLILEAICFLLQLRKKMAIDSINCNMLLWWLMNSFT